MSKEKRVVEIALAEVGYKETATNITKYAAEMAKTNMFNGNKQGYAWCGVFVGWCFYKAYGYKSAMTLLCLEDFSAAAGCIFATNYFRAQGQFGQVPHTGDQIFFYADGGINHTGIVVKVTNNIVTTVEGNSSDMVAKREYHIGDSRIAGYGHPRWCLLSEGDDDSAAPPDSSKPSIPRPQAECTVKLQVLRKGNKGAAVAALQAVLEFLGFGVGKYGVDGEFGADTESAVKLYQASRDLAADGICGKDTWGALMAGR